VQEALGEASPAGKSSSSKREEHDSDTDFQQTSDEDEAADVEPVVENVTSRESGVPIKRKIMDGKHNLIVKLKCQDVKEISKILDHPSKTAVSAMEVKRLAVKPVKEKSRPKSNGSTSNKSAKQPVTSMKRSTPNKDSSERVQKKVKTPVFKSTFQPQATLRNQPSSAVQDIRIASIDTVTTVYGSARKRVNMHTSPSLRAVSSAQQTPDHTSPPPSPSVKCQDTPMKQC